MNRRRWLAIGLVSVILAATFGGVSLAKTSAAKGDKAERAKYAQLYRERLAKRLGVDAAALDAARKGAAEDVIAQALKDGTITAEQAARLRQKLADGIGEGWFLGKGFGKSHHRMAKARVTNVALEAVLEKLGMTRGELKEALRSGKTIEDVAKAKGTTVAALGAVAAGAAKPVLDEMVKDGRITRANADAFLERLRSGNFLATHRRGFRKAA